jgi:hypothetical protein
MFYEPGPLPGPPYYETEVTVPKIRNAANTPGKFYRFGRYLKVSERKIIQVHPDIHDGYDMQLSGLNCDRAVSLNVRNFHSSTAFHYGGTAAAHST